MTALDFALRRVRGSYARGVKIAGAGGRAQERWTQDERDTLNVLLETGDAESMVSRSIAGGWYGRLISALTFLAHRGLIYVDGGAIRLTNLALQPPEQEAA